MREETAPDDIFKSPMSNDILTGDFLMALIAK
jgi:hypothetical protein